MVFNLVPGTSSAGGLLFHDINENYHRSHFRCNLTTWKNSCTLGGKMFKLMLVSGCYPSYVLRSPDSRNSRGPDPARETMGRSTFSFKVSDLQLILVLSQMPELNRHRVIWRKHDLCGWTQYRKNCVSKCSRLCSLSPFPLSNEIKCSFDWFAWALQ